jgi:glucose-specific phosphotransferase system IIA component
MVFGTKHALGLQSNDGVEVLIHVGVDTVNMEGAGFETFVEQGDEITKGQLIQTFDIGEIKQAGYSEVTSVIITNGFNFKEVKKVTE